MAKVETTAEIYDAQPGPRFGRSSWRNLFLLFASSFLTLYFELVIIRYLSTEVRVFAYLKNLALIASFFGIGYGMMLGRIPKNLKRWFPLIAASLLLLTFFASALRLTHIPVPFQDYQMYGETRWGVPWSGNWFILWYLGKLLEYVIVVPGFMYLIVGFFTVFGGLVGEQLATVRPLLGYGVNLAGSLAGILTFTAICFLGPPPFVWIFLGFVVALPFFLRERWTNVAFALIICVMAIPQPHTYWSPYDRITLEEVPPPSGWPHPAAYFLNVNHDYHQTIMNLSPQFVEQFPNVEPNHTLRPNYELPYRVVSNPGRVLVVGAGTGNDVATALRHGATHVDAVEIDPTIFHLGQKYHPERPYDSPKVTVHINDARAFFKTAKEKYDLIVFGYLDSHTLLTSMSSIRLDNYVYTVESFREARDLLRENGTLVLSCASGHTFLSDRLFATLASAFGTPPRAYFNPYEGFGVAFVEGRGKDSNAVTDFPEISKELEAHRAVTILATDHWPFLFLVTRTVPASILVVLALFLYFAVGMLHRNLSFRFLADGQNLHLFFLGAGFMLLETKGITELSLLFGSTWVVNAVVIAAFLIMGLLANSLVVVWSVPRHMAYIALFLLLVMGTFIPYSLLDALPTIEKVAAAGFLVGLPVFFSGLVFSRSFRDVAHPSQALGVNLLGAVVGGALENLVMIGGTPILGGLAIALYGLSAVSLARSLVKRVPSLEPDASSASA